MNPIVTNPLVLALAGVLSLLCGTLIVYLRIRRRQRRKAAEEAARKKATGVSIILLRGRTPLGKILSGCQFNNGQYTYLPKTPNPHLILYDGRYVRNDPDGEPFLFYDTESRQVVGYTGEFSNADDVTLIFHDGTAKDVTAAEAEKFRATEHPDGAYTVFRKHPSLWRVLNGARLFQEKTTMDWDNIQRTVPTWLGILQQFFPIIAIFFFVVLVIIGLIAVF